MKLPPRTAPSVFLLFMLLSGEACSNQDSENSRQDVLEVKQWLKVVNVDDDDSLNVRSEPNSQSSVVSVIAYDEKNIVKLEEKGKWIRINSAGSLGWVHSKFVDASNHESLRDILGKEFQCSGGEPHWTLSTSGGEVTYGLYGEESTFFLSSNFREGLSRNNIWYGHLSSKALDGRNMTVWIEKAQSCSDDMSDVNYPYRINVIDSNKHLVSGCCQN